MTRHSEESEKAIERYLAARVKELGGLCLKYHCPTATGFPDRIVLLPSRTCGWVELKSKGRRPTRLQLERIKALSLLGFTAAVCDSRRAVDEYLSQLKQKSNE